MARISAAALKQKIDANLTASAPDAEDITAAEVRGVLGDMVDSLGGVKLAAIPTPGHIDKANLPARFDFTLLMAEGAYSGARTARVTMAGVDQIVAAVVGDSTIEAELPLNLTNAQRATLLGRADGYLESVGIALRNAANLEIADTAVQLRVVPDTRAKVIDTAVNRTLGAADEGQTIRLTGNAARTFATSAGLRTAWWARLLNASSADLTFDTGVGGTIVGGRGGTLVIKPGESVTVQYLGASTWAVLADTEKGGAGSGDESGGTAARELVVLADARLTLTAGNPAIPVGQATVQWPADFAEYREWEVVVADNGRTVATLQGRTAWLALQQDNDVNLGFLDKDEAGSRQWVVWTPSTRTFSLGGQSATNVQRFVAARLYDPGGGGGSGEVPDGSLTPAKSDTDTAAKMAAFRAAYGSAHVGQGNDLPNPADFNPRDVFLFVQANANTAYPFAEANDLNTPIRVAEFGDAMINLGGRAGWIRFGNLSQTRARAAQATADRALARTQRLRPVNQWAHFEGAQTLFVEWKPSVAVPNGAALTVNLGGVPVAGVTAPFTIAADDTEGVLLSLAVATAGAANIDRASNTIAGHVQLQITYGGVTDTTWIGTRKPTGWRPLTGASPYTVRREDDEFMVVTTHTQGANVRRLRRVVPREEVTEVAITEVVAEAAPQVGDLNAWVGFSLALDAAGTELTVARQQGGGGGGNYAIHRVYAR